MFEKYPQHRTHFYVDHMQREESGQQSGWWTNGDQHHASIRAARRYAKKLKRERKGRTITKTRIRQVDIVERIVK